MQVEQLIQVFHEYDFDRFISKAIVLKTFQVSADLTINAVSLDDNSLGCQINDPADFIIFLSKAINAEKADANLQFRTIPHTIVSIISVYVQHNFLSISNTDKLYAYMLETYEVEVYVNKLGFVVKTSKLAPPAKPTIAEIVAETKPIIKLPLKTQSTPSPKTKKVVELMKWRPMPSVENQKKRFNAYYGVIMGTKTMNCIIYPKNEKNCIMEYFTVDAFIENIEHERCCPKGDKCLFIFCLNIHGDLNELKQLLKQFYKLDEEKTFTDEQIHNHFWCKFLMVNNAQRVTQAELTDPLSYLENAYNLMKRWSTNIERSFGKNPKISDN